MRIFPKILFFLYIATLLFLTYASFAGIDLDVTRTDILGIPIDKCIHFLMFLPYPILAFFAFKRNHYWRTLFYVGLTGTLIAFLLELSQGLLTTDRITEVWDLVANVGAIVIGTSALLLFKRERSGDGKESEYPSGVNK